MQTAQILQILEPIWLVTLGHLLRLQLHLFLNILNVGLLNLAVDGVLLLIKHLKSGSVLHLGLLLDLASGIEVLVVDRLPEAQQLVEVGHLKFQLVVWAKVIFVTSVQLFHFVMAVGDLCELLVIDQKRRPGCLQIPFVKKSHALFSLEVALQMLAPEVVLPLVNVFTAESETHF